MKSALILEKDAASCAKLSRLLKWLGYLPAPVRTPDEALNAAETINFDVIVTYTAKREHDRRSFTSQLKRLAPKAAIIVIAESNDNADPRIWRQQGDAAVIRRPASVEALRSIVEFGIDGYGLQPLPIPVTQERRKTALNCLSRQHVC